MEQFIRFINSGDPSQGRPIISDDVIFFSPTSPEPLRGFEGYVQLLATGKPVRITAMNIYEFRDGKIVREHGLPDIFSMLV